jgi:hypothetical protein
MKYVLALLVAFAATDASCQEENLLSGLDTIKPQKEYISNAFKSSRVIMSHSIEMVRAGVMDFRILHRFGNVNQGRRQFFGLDQASIRLGLDYAINNNLTVGVGRASFKKEIDGFIKWRVIQQAIGPKALPFSLVLVNGYTIMGAPWSNPTITKKFSSRIGYYVQAIAGRKFNDMFTLQVSPILLHRNFVETTNAPDNLVAIGFAGRIKLTKRTSFNLDYYFVFDQNTSGGYPQSIVHRF